MRRARARHPGAEAVEHHRDGHFDLTGGHLTDALEVAAQATAEHRLKEITEAEIISAGTDFVEVGEWQRHHAQRLRGAAHRRVEDRHGGAVGRPRGLVGGLRPAPVQSGPRELRGLTGGVPLHRHDLRYAAAQQLRRGRRRVGDDHRDRRPRVGGQRGGIEQLPGQGDPAETRGECVVGAHEQRGATIGQPLGIPGLPQRPAPVQRGPTQPEREVEQAPQVGRLRDGDLHQVMGERDIAGVHPALLAHAI